MKINKTSIIRAIASVLCSGSLTLSAADAGHGKNGGYDYVSLSTSAKLDPSLTKGVPINSLTMLARKYI